MLSGVDLGKYDLSFATEYCYIPHKSLEREKRLRKPDLIGLFFYEICLYVVFDDIVLPRGGPYGCMPYYIKGCL